MFGASIPMIDAKHTSTRPVMNTRRAPKRVPSRPAIGAQTAVAIYIDEITQDTSDEEPK